MSIMKFFLPFLLFSSLCWRLTEQSNILGLFPHFGYSHFKVYHPILRALAERGHKVTVVSYIQNTDPHPNYEDLLLSGADTVDLFSFEHHVGGRSLSILFAEFYELHVEGQLACERFYSSGYVEEIIKRHAEQPYDMIILEIFNTDCHLGLSYLLQVPVVGLSSCALMPWHYSRVALPDSPSYIQTEVIGFPEELSWNDRLINFITINGQRLLYRLTEWKDNAVIRKYLSLDVDVHEIAKSTSLIFVNQHYSLSGNRPLTSQVKEIGGVHIPPKENYPKIPQEIDTFLKKSNGTVLFFSFGSMVRSSTMDVKKIQGIVRAVKKLNLWVIWRWDNEKVPLVDEQFIFSKWVPQLTLLCHPKVKLFWGHGGMLGVTEAVHCGKPLLVTPIYGDQFLNGKAVENRKVGAIVEYQEISEQRVFEALSEIMRHRYTEKAVALSKVFRNRETTPLATALWWIEHVLNEDIAKHLLQTKASNLHWFIYYSLDSICIILVSIILPIIILLLGKRRYF